MPPRGLIFTSRLSDRAFDTFPRVYEIDGTTDSSYSDPKVSIFFHIARKIFTTSAASTTQGVFDIEHRSLEHRRHLALGERQAFRILAKGALEDALDPLLAVSVSQEVPYLLLVSVAQKHLRLQLDIPRARNRHMLFSSRDQKWGPPSVEKCGLVEECFCDIHSAYRGCCQSSRSSGLCRALQELGLHVRVQVLVSS